MNVPYLWFAGNHGGWAGSREGREPVATPPVACVARRGAGSLSPALRFCLPPPRRDASPRGKGASETCQTPPAAIEGITGK